MQDFQDATAVTMHTYQHVASIYADTHKSENMPDFWRQRLTHFVEMVRTSAGYQHNPSLPVLDIGCGPGRDALLLAQAGFDVIAADLSEEMLEEAHQRTEHQPGVERITFRRMDMRAIELADASCAGLWASASFLHIPKKENLTVLREVARVLPSGGPLMLLVKENDGGEVERYEPHTEMGQMRFFARYNGAELWALLEQAGLTVNELTATMDRRYPNGQRWLGALATKK